MEGTDAATDKLYDDWYRVATGTAAAGVRLIIKIIRYNVIAVDVRTEFNLMYGR